MGPPGSGKGTQGQRLGEALGLDHIAVGDLLRAEVEAGTDLGHRVAATMASGDLIDDDLIIELIGPLVRAAADRGGFILDGYPRTLTQAVVARQAASQAEVEADIVVWLDVPARQLIDRLVARATDEGRADDNAETVSRRLQVYEEATRPLLDYYQGRGLLATIEASGDPASVTDAILATIDTRRAATGR